MKRLLFFFVLSLFSFVGLQAKTIDKPIKTEQAQITHTIISKNVSQGDLFLWFCTVTIIDVQASGVDMEGNTWYTITYTVSCNEITLLPS